MPNVKVQMPNEPATTPAALKVHGVSEVRKRMDAFVSFNLLSLGFGI